MKYNKVYEVDPAFIDGGVIRWNQTGNGEFILADKAGERCFVKRNWLVRRPSPGMPAEAYKVLKTAADRLENKQKRLRTLMKGLTASGDRIVVENRNFWDDDTNMYVTETDFISGGLPSDYDYSALSREAFLNLAIQTAELMAKLHAHGVIHGDLKPANFVVTEKGEKYTPYLIDFDSAYPADAIPEWESIGGTEGYQSPEVVLYGSDENAAPKETITSATDIFTMGVVFHKWWTGSFPDVDLENGTIGAAVYLDRRVTIDKKFDVMIGDNYCETLQSLLNWMFAKDPAERPTAEQVMQILCDKAEISDKFRKSNSVNPFDDKLWESHLASAELLPRSELISKGVRSFARFNDGTGSNGCKYRVADKSGKESIMTVEELCNAGYAVRKPAEITTPWEEHMIEFEPEEVIWAKGYAKIERFEFAYRKRYRLTKVTGVQIDVGRDRLIEWGLAHLKIAEIDADTPWPEHGSSYNNEAMAQMNVKSISRMDVGGEHRYRIVYNEIVDGKNKTNEKVHVNNIKLMGFIK